MVSRYFVLIIDNVVCQLFGKYSSFGNSQIVAAAIWHPSNVESAMAIYMQC